MERITVLVKSNLNEILDRVEDPVRMVDQIVRDVEDSVDRPIMRWAGLRLVSVVVSAKYSAIAKRSEVGGPRPKKR